MNHALLRFVTDYLADHAARADAGEGPRGRVHIDPRIGSGFELRFESKRCHLAPSTADSADARVQVPWLRLIQLLDEELDPRDALELGMVSIDGDQRLAEHALEWLHESGFGWHVYKQVPVWQLQVNLGAMSLSEIRGFAHDTYGQSLAASIDKPAAINSLVDLFRAGPRLSEAARSKFPEPIHKSCIRFQAEQLQADFELLRARLQPEEKYCPGCEDAAECTLGDDCGRLEYGWTLQSFGEDHQQAVFGGPRSVLESRAVVKTEACFGIFEDIVDSIPGACRARLKVYRRNYRFGHLPHTDACDLVRSIIPIYPGSQGALSVEPSFGAFERDSYYHSYDLDEPGRLYWFPSWLMHSGRNASSDQERVFLLISQRFDDDTRRLQGSVEAPIRSPTALV
jgi:hypothetical protein